MNEIVDEMKKNKNLAHSLEGLTIGKWTVLQKIENKGSTGGFFSVGYIAKNEKDEEGFLKALDYSAAFNSPDSVAELYSMTKAFIFERELLNSCTDKRLQHIVKIVDSGRFELPVDYPDRDNYFIPNIDYMVFEKAEQSVRALIDLSKEFDCAWALRSLHNTAVGINELHGLQVAHQDIKPSNILLFNKNTVSKIGDVGRSSMLGKEADHDALLIPGDRNYSPLELRYGEVASDWKVRRFSCDMYMFGNLIYTYFNNVSLTNAVLNKLPLESKPQNWGESYEAVLPQIEMAFSQCLEEFNNNLDSSLRADLMGLVRELCCPRVSLRGDNKETGLQRYSMQRYISRLDYLARKYEHRLKKVLI